MIDPTWIVEKRVGNRWQTVSTWGKESEALAAYERECEFSDNWENGLVKIRYEERVVQGD